MQIIIMENRQNQQLSMSQLTLAALHNACNSASVEAHNAKCQKHSSNDPKRQRLGWLICVPLACSSKLWELGQREYSVARAILSRARNCSWLNLINSACLELYCRSIIEK